MRLVFCGGLSGQGEESELSSSEPSTQKVGCGMSLRGVSLRRLLKRWEVREGRGTYRGSRLLARTLGSPGGVVLRMSGAENRVTEFVEVSG